MEYFFPIAEQWQLGYSILVHWHFHSFFHRIKVTQGDLWVLKKSPYLGGQASFHVVLLEERHCRKHLCVAWSFFIFWKKKKTSSFCVLSSCVTSEGVPRRVRQPINWSNTAGAGNHWAPQEFETRPLPPSRIILKVITFLGKSWTSIGHGKGHQASIILLLKWKKTLNVLYKSYTRKSYMRLSSKLSFQTEFFKMHCKIILWRNIKNNYGNIFYRNEN